MTTTTCELKPSFYFQAIVNTLLHRFLSVALNQGSSFTSIVETNFFFFTNISITYVQRQKNRRSKPWTFDVRVLEKSLKRHCFVT